MINELISNKWVWFGIGLFALIIVQRLFFSKDKATEILEREYNEIINSEKYKVKGQY